MFEVKEGQRPHNKLKAWLYVLLLAVGVYLLATGDRWYGVFVVLAAAAGLITMARGLNTWGTRSFFDPPRPGAAARPDPPPREDPARIDLPHRQVH